jgi:hypothetical protein
MMFQVEVFLVVTSHNDTLGYRRFGGPRWQGYLPRINVIKDGNGNLLADPQNALNRWKNFFNQVLKVYGIHDVRQMDIHTAEPLVPEPSLIEVEIVKV